MDPAASVLTLEKPTEIRRIHRAPRDPRLKWALILAACWAIQTGLRIWFAWPGTVPSADPDEVGYLSGARALLGLGTGADLSGNTFYSAGYSLLIAPWLWVTHDADQFYRLVQFENAALGALIVPLAFLFLRRCGSPLVEAVLVAFAVGLLPCTAFFGAYALTDAILPVLILSWLLLTHSWLTGATDTRAGRIAVTCAGCAAAALAGFSYLVHDRGIVLVVVQSGLLVVAFGKRWGTGLASVLSAGVLLASCAIGNRINDVVQHRLYPKGIRDLNGIARGRVDTLDGWGWILRVATGQVWYQVVVTGGLAAIGVIMLIRLVGQAALPGQTRVLAFSLLALFFGIALTTSAALPDETRVGIDAYGRYLACITPVLVLVGVATLLHARKRTAVVLATAALASTFAGAAVVRIFAGAALQHDSYVPFDFPDLSGLTWDWSHFQLWHAAEVSAALTVALFLGSRLPGRAALFTVALMIGALGTTTLVGDREHILEPKSAQLSFLTESPTAASSTGDGEAVAFDNRIPWWVVLIMQYRQGWDHPVRFRSTPPAGADLVLTAWDGRTSPAATWPKAAAAHFHIVSERSAFGTGWVAWAPDRTIEATTQATS